MPRRNVTSCALVRCCIGHVRKTYVAYFPTSLETVHALRTLGRFSWHVKTKDYMVRAHSLGFSSWHVRKTLSRFVYPTQSSFVTCQEEKIHVGCTLARCSPHAKKKTDEFCGHLLDVSSWHATKTNVLCILVRLFSLAGQEEALHAVRLLVSCYLSLVISWRNVACSAYKEYLLCVRLLAFSLVLDMSRRTSTCLRALVNLSFRQVKKDDYMICIHFLDVSIWHGNKTNNMRCVRLIVFSSWHVKKTNYTSCIHLLMCMFDMSRRTVTGFAYTCWILCREMSR